MGKSNLSKKIEKKTPAKFDPATLGKPPTGMVWVYNRLSTPYALTFAANEESWDAHEVRMVHSDLATYCDHKSIHRLDPTGLHNVMVLVTPDDEAFGKPLPKHLEEPKDELLIRDGQIVPKDVETIKVD